MNNQYQKEPFLRLTQDEMKIINELRKLNFGRILINIQNGVVVSMEVTKIKKNQKKNKK